MGEGNFRREGWRTVHFDYLPDDLPPDEDGGFWFDDAVELIRNCLSPSYSPSDRWIDRDIHVIAESKTHIIAIYTGPTNAINLSVAVSDKVHDNMISRAKSLVDTIADKLFLRLMETTSFDLYVANSAWTSTPYIAVVRTKEPVHPGAQ